MSYDDIPGQRRKRQSFAGQLRQREAEQALQTEGGPEPHENRELPGNPIVNRERQCALPFRRVIPELPIGNLDVAAGIQDAGEGIGRMAKRRKKIRGINLTHLRGERERGRVQPERPRSPDLAG